MAGTVGSGRGGTWARIPCPHSHLVLCPAPRTEALHPKEGGSTRLGEGVVRQRKEPLRGEPPSRRGEANALLSGNLQAEEEAQVLMGQAKQDRKDDRGDRLLGQGDS